MEWSFRVGGHGRRRQCIFISTRDLKKVTLSLSVSFEGEKRKRDLFCKTVYSAVAVEVM